MKIDGNTIIFKSDDDVFFKEEAGIKPNTTRFVWEKHELPMIVNFYKEIQEEVKYIKIHNKRSPNLFFKRQIRDIYWYEDRLVWIISWFHEENGIQDGFNAPIRSENDRHWMNTRGRKP